MPKGIFSATLSAVGSLSLSILVLIVTLQTREGASAPQSQNDKAPLLEARADAFLRAGSRADMKAALPMMAASSRTEAQKRLLASLFRNKRLFDGYLRASLRGGSIRCVSGESGERCEVQGAVSYTKGNAGTFSAVFMMEGEAWNIHSFTLNRD